MSQKPRVAIVYDWVTTPEGGAEKVLVALHQAFPEAVLYTSVTDLQTAHWAQIWKPHSSFLQTWPLLRHHHRWTLPFLPLAFEALDLSQFEIIISVTSAFAKGILTRPDQLHVCYLLTPPRFLYSQVSDYFSPLMTRLLQPLIHYLKWWDRVAAWRPDSVIALSQTVAQRYQTIYHRAVTRVMYPTIVNEVVPVAPAHLPSQPYFVIVSRLVAYKRLDLAIQACQELGYSLYIIGTGPEKAALEQITYKPELIHWLGFQDDATCRWYLAHAQALIMPGVEDFGITALEAASVGTPTILQATSGVAEVLQSKMKFELTSLDLGDLKQQLTQAAQESRSGKLIHPSSLKYATTTFAAEVRRVVLEMWSDLNTKGHHEHD